MLPNTDQDKIAEGQFEDAEEVPSTRLDHAPFYNPREGQAFIDDDLSEYSEFDEDPDPEEATDDEEWGTRAANVDDEDWELAERGRFQSKLTLGPHSYLWYRFYKAI